MRIDLTINIIDDLNTTFCSPSNHILVLPRGRGFLNNPKPISSLSASRYTMSCILIELNFTLSDVFYQLTSDSYFNFNIVDLVIF